MEPGRRRAPGVHRDLCAGDLAQAGIVAAVQGLARVRHRQERAEGAQCRCGGVDLYGGLAVVPG